MKNLLQLLILNILTTSCWGQILINGKEGNIIYAPLGNKIEVLGFGSCYDLKAEIEGQNEETPMMDCSFKINYLVKDTAQLRILRSGEVLVAKTLIEERTVAHAYISIDKLLIADSTITKDQFYKMNGIEVHYNCPWLKTRVIGFVLIVEDAKLGAKGFQIEGNKLNPLVLEQLAIFKNPIKIYVEGINYVPQFEYDSTEPLRLSVK